MMVISEKKPAGGNIDTLETNIGLYLKSTSNADV